MKNSPDAEWFSLQQRLRGYTEEPDAAVWDRIAAQTGGQKDPLWVSWLNRSAAVLSLLLIVWSLNEPIAPVANTPGRAMDEQRSKEEAPSTLKDAEEESPTEQQASIGVGNDDLYEAKPARLSSGTTEAQTSEEKAVETIDLATPEIAEATDIVAADTASLSRTAEQSRKPVRRRRVRIYGSVSPSLAFQKTTPFANDGVRIESFYSRPVLSTGRMGVSLQAGIQQQIGRRFEIYAGLSFYTHAQQIVYHYYSEEMIADRDKDFGYTVGPGVVRKSVKYDMVNAGLDAGLMYFLTGDRVLQKAGAGLSWQHGFKGVSEDATYDNSRSHYLQYQLFYRSELVVNRRLNIFIQPFFKHVLLSSEALDEPFRVRPYHAGLTFGVVCNLP